ncbi:MAG TPA: hypothetical protein VJ970_02145 [Flavobacteriaceae bacterium]|nr:hypothetical protein [Flavobacteriaceae bacterium]
MSKKEEKNKKYNSDVTEDDLQALGDKKNHLRTDGGDDKVLKNRKKPVDFAAKDLDIPGRKIPSNKKGKLPKDEENKHYSLGSEHNANLESDSEK